MTSVNGENQVARATLARAWWPVCCCFAVSASASPVGADTGAGQGETYYFRNGAILNAAFHPTRPLLLVVGRKEHTDALGVLRLYDIGTGDRVASAPKAGAPFCIGSVLPRHAYTAVAFSPNGNRFALASLLPPDSLHSH